MPTDIAELALDADFDAAMDAYDREMATPVRPRRMRRLVRGRPDDPAWVRPALIVLLLATAGLYLWDLGASGWANTYYSAAVQAGTKSWKAWFFGSLDSGNSITVDKSPAALWVMGLSARVFGVNAWSILAPQALEGVAAVGVVYATVRRWFTPAAALIAGAVTALTPVAVLMFRFNNPDALLVLLLVAGAYALTRSLEAGSTRWLVLAMSFVGFGFLAKMLQALLVIPVFALVYLLAGPPKLGRRIWQLALSGVAFVVACGWWIAVVQLWPASSRPYIGGSQNNSLWNVIFGYNGFGRLTGDESGSVGGAGNGTGRWGPTGLTRLFNDSFGGEASWLLPAALVLLVAGLVLTMRRARTDRTRAAFLLWGGWLLVTGLAFSLGKGIIHPYYAIALAPAIGALIGVGATQMWQHRNHPAARAALTAAFVATVWWSYRLLDRTPQWHPWLRHAIVVAGAVIALLLAFGWTRLLRRGAGVVAVGALVVGLAGPAAYSLATATTPHRGAIPSSGPSGAAGPGGFPGRFGAGAFARNGLPPGANPFGGGALPNFGNGGPPALPGGGAFPGGAFPGGPGGGGLRGGIGGLLNGSTPSAALTRLLERDASSYTWVAATIGANNAAGYQLATDDAVMAIGGFNGSDPSPTLAQFKAYVAAHKIHYFIAGGGFGGAAGGNGTGVTIASWVAANFTAKTVGGTTVYDLTA